MIKHLSRSGLNLSALMDPIQSIQCSVKRISSYKSIGNVRLDIRYRLTVLAMLAVSATTIYKPLKAQNNEAGDTC
jgi:hypothetical protein